MRCWPTRCLPSARKRVPRSAPGRSNSRLLARLAARGLSTAALELDFASAAGTLSLSRKLAGEPERAAPGARLRPGAGTFDIVSCRYIIEHSPDPVAALMALKALLKPGRPPAHRGSRQQQISRRARLLFPMGGAQLLLRRRDASPAGQAAGFRVLSATALSGSAGGRIDRRPSGRGRPCNAALRTGPSHLFRGLPRPVCARTRARSRARLAGAAGPGKDRLALFGIGHHAIMFVNAFDLGDDIALAVDDDPGQGWLFPPRLSGARGRLRGAAAE